MLRDLERAKIVVTNLHVPAAIEFDTLLGPTGSAPFPMGNGEHEVHR